MAPNLAAAQHELIRDMTLSKSLKYSEVARVAGCNTRTIKKISANPRYFGRTTASQNEGGRPRTLTSLMLDALRDRLLEKPDL